VFLVFLEWRRDRCFQDRSPGRRGPCRRAEGAARFGSEIQFRRCVQLSAPEQGLRGGSGHRCWIERVTSSAVSPHRSNGPETWVVGDGADGDTRSISS